MLIKKEQLTQEPLKTYNKKQVNILARSLAVAAIGFLLIVAIGYGINYGYEHGKISLDTIDALAGVGVTLSLVLMLSLFFMRPSIGLYITLLTAYVASSGIGFASLFNVFNMGELLSIFGITGLVFGFTALLAFVLPPKVIGSIVKLSMVSIIFASIFSIVFCIVGCFTSLGKEWEWYSYFTTILLTLFCVGYNIYLFYTISKMQEFHNENTDSKQLHLLVLMLGFNILVSFVQMIWRIAYIFSLFKGN